MSVDVLDELRTESIVSVERALAIIERLADRQDGLSFTEIVALLDVNKAIAFKLLNTLEHSGYLFRNERSGAYCLTYRITNLALRKLSAERLLDQSNAILRPLADATGELVRLAVVERGGERITWVLSLRPERQVLQIDPNYSMEIGLHTHAAGKAWLATLPFGAALRLVRASGFKPKTRHSLTTTEALRAELARSAARGYALTYEEHALGVGAIGVPVMVSGPDGARACVGAVTVAAPCVRMTRKDLEALAPRVRAAAAKLAEAWPADALTARG
jgi:DNA-binding IclR family transcriptional regulator